MLHTLPLIHSLRWLLQPALDLNPIKIYSKSNSDFKSLLRKCGNECGKVGACVALLKKYCISRFIKMKLDAQIFNFL